MDGTTEQIIVVIGHPIAGNPAQFAAERALRAMKLEWRVLSFEVLPDDVGSALEGFRVTGIRGVVIDRSLANEARQWHAESTDGSDFMIDCLARDRAGQLVGSYQQRNWVDEQVSLHGGQRLIWMGQRDQDAPASGKNFEDYPAVPENMSELTADADVIIINQSGGKPIDLEIDEWSSDNGSTLVIDLTDGHPRIADIKQLGYQVIGLHERQIGTLIRCLHRCTGERPAIEVIHDAIEEYFSV